MSRVLVNIEFEKNGHQLKGYLTQNKSQLYYPTVDRAVIFGSLYDALKAVSSVVNEYDVTKVNYINLQDKPMHEISDLDLDYNLIDEVVRSLIESRFELNSFKVEQLTGGVVIKWNYNMLIYGNPITFNPGYCELDPDHIELDYDEKLISDIINLIEAVCNGENVKEVLNKLRK